MEERRKFIRIIEALKISYKVMVPPDGTGECLTKNVGEGGISFTVQQKLNPGDVLELEISIPTVTSSVKATGQVVWVKEIKKFNLRYMMGVKFIVISPFERDEVLHYIREKLGSGRSDEVGWFE
jgi:hypothetical protein